jgi:hypothetical protein
MAMSTMMEGIETVDTERPAFEQWAEILDEHLAAKLA